MAKKKPSAKSKLEQLADVRLTHPERALYAEQGITKLDLARYYVDVAERVLPHVAGRPLSLVRCPAGMQGDCFFQKHPPTGLSADVERVSIREKSGKGTYLVVHDVRGLMSLVQFGALEIHVWGCRADEVERPDRMVFDLDPGPDVAWKTVTSGAAEVRERLADHGLKSFVKTSGGKGLHVVVPLDGAAKWAEMKGFAKSLAGELASDEPQRYVDVMSKAARKGKIFVDYLRNERGATTVAAYSTRARAGAPVSLPVAWRELTKVRAGDQFRLSDVPRRVVGRSDPWKGIERVDQSLAE